MTMEKHHTGLASEFLVMAHLAGCGQDVFNAAGNSRADFVRVSADGTFKCQVKTATRTKTGQYEYEQTRLEKKSSYTTKNGDRWISKAYTEEEIDEIWIVGTHVWCFPLKTILGHSSLCLLSNGPKPRQKSYRPNEHIVVYGDWKNPIRHILRKSE